MSDTFSMSASRVAGFWNGYGGRLGILGGLEG